MYRPLRLVGHLDLEGPCAHTYPATLTTNGFDDVLAPRDIEAAGGAQKFDEFVAASPRRPAKSVSESKYTAILSTMGLRYGRDGRLQTLEK